MKTTFLVLELVAAFTAAAIIGLAAAYALIVTFN